MMRVAIRGIVCLLVLLAIGGITSPAHASCYPPPCSASADAGPALPAAVSVAPESGADPVDSRSPVPVVGFALLLVMATLTTLCVSRYQQRAMPEELADRRASQPTALTGAGRSVA